jgi:hypothetical protein
MTGVSPVVRVILVVAVTVIIAAVIGSFVLDLGSNVQANPRADVTFSETTDSAATDVAVRVISMQNADRSRFPHPRPPRKQRILVLEPTVLMVKFDIVSRMWVK